MPHKNQSEITFTGLQQFLRRIGFHEAAKVNSSLAFNHDESSTLIVLSIPPDGQTVRSADLVSILMRLETQGLVDDAVLEQFRLGKLPLAS